MKVRDLIEKLEGLEGVKDNYPIAFNTTDCASGWDCFGKTYGADVCVLRSHNSIILYAFNREAEDLPETKTLLVGDFIKDLKKLDEDINVFKIESIICDCHRSLYISRDTPFIDRVEIEYTYTGNEVSTIYIN